ncbi:MAG: 3-hydroxyacyl-CoA dehydrogenase family protein [Rhodospirillales bacterium]|nr:3-hydroxyacyl-CoA dehydrogenase family protein [Rhodospirillales bacterium]
MAERAASAVRSRSIPAWLVFSSHPHQSALSPRRNGLIVLWSLQNSHRSVAGERFAQAALTGCSRIAHGISTARGNDMDIQNVGIIGTGAMGLGIAQVCAHNGFPVTAVKATPGSWERAKTTVEKSFGRIVERGKMTADERDAAMSRITFSTDEHAVACCDLIVESVIEDIDTKKDLFRRLESICRPDALLTTNTSTLSVTAMMAVCKHRGRVAGLHFFNPAPVMKLVEIIHGFETSDETLSDLDAFCKKIGKDPVIVQDTTGFIVNRLLTPYMLNAIRMLERGTGTIESIDHAMRSGAAHPMGPFELADYIGLDVVEAMATNIFHDVRHEHHAPPHTLTRLVQLGYLGRKTGKGFYDYAQKPAVQNPALLRPVV